MKKTLSVFLSFVMLLTCLCVGGISAGAAEKKSNIHYLYDPECQTMYIRGNGAVPERYLGWSTSQDDDYGDMEYNWRKNYRLEWQDENGPDGSYTSPEMNEEIMIRQIYPRTYVEITRFVKKIVFESGITSIGYAAFSCAFPNLEEIEFANTITRIDSAFEGYTKLKSVVIPSNVKVIDGNAFFMTTPSIVFRGNNTKFISSNNDNPFRFLGRIYCLPGSAIEKQCKQNNANPNKEKVDYKVIKTPAQVSGVKAATTGSTVKLTWNKAKYANRYKVQRYVVSQKKWKTYATVTGTSYTFKNMAGSTNYRFRVIGVNRICDADFSGKASKECKAKTKFGKVLGVKVSAKNGTLSAKWNAVREAKSYQVYYATKKDGSYKKLGTATGTSFKKKVTKGKTYYVKVRAVKKNSKGKTVYGAYSDVKSVYVDW